MATFKAVDDLSKVFSRANLKMYAELMKLRLSSLVAFSAGFGYLLGLSGPIDWFSFAGLFVGGLLISGSSSVLNQVFEQDVDRLMKRTHGRPIPTGQIRVEDAVNFAWFIGFAGFTLLMLSTNFLTALLSLSSFCLYTFIYTPLKRVGPIAVIIGAIPGALPPLLGWVAATGQLSFEAFILFTVQFTWQFPHFWAIAWVSYEDYSKAGFKLLPSHVGKDRYVAFQMFMSTLFLLPAGWLPYLTNMTGVFSAWAVTVLGVLFLIPAVSLLFSHSRKDALRIMFGSFLYLPITQILYLLDKQ